LHIGGIQIVVGWEVHAAPFGASGWVGALGAHPREQQGLFGHLRPRFQSDADCYPP